MFAQSLPAPWSSLDIGAPSAAGSAFESAGAFTVSGAGSDIGRHSDQFHFAYQPISGDVEIVARVASLKSVHRTSKAGVMIRETLSGPSPYAFMTGTAARGWAFQRRPAAGARSVSSPGSPGAPPGWVKVVRAGDTFSGYESVDGTNWILLGTETIAMPQVVFIGLAVTSSDASRTATATFTDVLVRQAAGPANALPEVTLTAPATDSLFTSPVALDLTALARDPDGTVIRVDFFANGALLGSDASDPYSFRWNGLPEGTHHLTAVASDDAGESSTSQTATITVRAPTNEAPHVTLTSPAANATFTAPVTLTLSAMAADRDGTVGRVDFYANGQPVGSATASPYTVGWSNVAAGSYSLTAVARDDDGAATTSAAVTITVGAPNQSPSVTLTSPSAGSTFTAPAAVTLSAIATDRDGTIGRVDFYANGHPVGSATASPYTVGWNNVAAGSYSLTAVARDDDGAATTSAPVTITVSALPAPVPTRLAFGPSADHDTVVTSYRVALYRAADAVSAPALVSSNLGKPAPVNGDIVVDISTIVNPLPAGSYYAVVTAIAPNGATASSPSAPFVK